VVTADTCLLHRFARGSELGEVGMSEGLQVDVFVLRRKSPLVAPQKVKPCASPREGRFFDRDLSVESTSGTSDIHHYLQRR
jgi:hypothetical protein